MDRKRKLAILFAAVAVAAGSGHLMQRGREAPAVHRVAAGAAPAAAPAASPAPAPAAVAGAAPGAAAGAAPGTAPGAAPGAVAASVPPDAAGAAPAAVAAAAPALPQPALPQTALPATAAAETAPLGTAPVATAPGEARAAVAVPLAVAAAAPAVLPPAASLPRPAPADAPAALAAAAAAPGAPDCSATLALSLAPAAMVDLFLAAPCDAGARIVVRHAGLAVTGRTGRDGRFLLSIPALAETAEVEVMLPDGRRLAERIEVPGLAAFDRLAVQWQAPDLFELHGFEAGAGYGAPGHLSAAATQGASGFLTLLGDPEVERPMFAEVLTLRRGALEDGSVRVTVEAPVLAATCGRELLAELIERRAGRAARVTELTLPAPDCGEVGGYAVIPWTFGEDRLAGN